MTRLRKISLIGIVTLIALAVIGTLAVAYQQWVLAAITGYVTLLLTMISIFFGVQFMTHNVRTSERNAKLTTQKLAARINVATQGFEKSHAQLQRQILKTQKLIHEGNNDSQRSYKRAETRMNDLDQNLQNTLRGNARNVRSIVHDSTQQIEAMLQLYGRYDNLKLPMPNTGGYAIDAQALGHLITLVDERQPMRILELGSGTSTIWLGYLCRTYGGKLVSLDHLEKYLALTKQAVKRHQLEEQIECRFAPLEKTECDGRTFDWYSADALEDQHDIDLLIADGPPQSTGPQARYPSLPKLIDRLAPKALVVLDDAHRKDEANIVDAWLQAYPDFEKIEHGTSRLAVLQRRNG
ncbi:O-methyltransferase [Enteractinococcus coprophilus]|uniref:Putative O-methyltransferase YrrM n=1 Tax=Enteractinococcus coprophilus TaxID=1027633 RepID=A0A543AIM4_9MICC|nr:class I SAM-dependent methyltransferase [Enteractinococcus coprophilus]TQL72421.1 putative O-methyltransferase YrrM [Enteractinococcus coprophilus]